MAFLLGFVSCLPLAMLFDRNVEASPEKPWRAAEESSDAVRFLTFAAVAPFLGFICLEWIVDDLPTNIYARVQNLAGAALSVSVVIVIALLRKKQDEKRPSK